MAEGKKVTEKFLPGYFQKSLLSGRFRQLFNMHDTKAAGVKTRQKIRSIDPNRLESRKYNFHKNFLFTVLAASASFIMLYYLKRDSFFSDGTQIQLFVIYLVSALISGVLSNKFFLTRKHELIQVYRKLFISMIIMLGLISLSAIMNSVENVSRLIVAGSVMLTLAAEIIYFTVLNIRAGNGNGTKMSPQFSFLYLGCDLMLLGALLYPILMMQFKAGLLGEKHIASVGLILISWIFAGATTHRFHPVRSAANLWEATGLQIKFYLLIISSTAITIFFLNINPAYQSYFIKGILVYAGLSFGVFVIMYSNRIKSLTDDVTSKLLRAYEMKGPATSPKASTLLKKYSIKKKEITESYTRHKLQLVFLKDHPEVFEFIDRRVDLRSIDIRRTNIVRTADLYNIESIENNSLDMLLNLHEMNDYRKINRFLHEVNRKLSKGGIYSGCFISTNQRYKYITGKYKTGFGNIDYIMDFIWHRVFPKLPLLKQLYFYLSRGRNRAISLAEGLGRLVYCGFEILDITELEDKVFYVVRKARESNFEKNPSYSFIFKMKRLGMNGKPIYVYKLRTMHPYSEYLQDFIYLQNKLAEGGKFKDDFRITSWGKMFRALWIDELPMIYNYLRGDLKLVGVRPISHQYLSLYSPEFAEWRKMFKPGLIPPYYADLPKTIQEIEQSERRYLEAYYNSGFRTDVKYFLKVVKNIVFMRKRSA